MTRTLAAVAPALVAVAFAACGLGEGEQSCTLQGCSSTIELLVSHAAWSPGTWEIRLAGDGETWTCSFTVAPDRTIPEAGCDNEGLEPADWTRLSPPVGAQGPARVGFTTAEPETLEVEIRRDGATVHEATLEPDYERYWPNGPDCGPTCRRAAPELRF